jgi:hypothetical protein
MVHATNVATSPYINASNADANIAHINGRPVRDRPVLHRADAVDRPQRSDIARRNASHTPSPCRQGWVKLIAAAHENYVGDARQAKAVVAQTARLLEQKRGYDAQAVSVDTISITGTDQADKARQLRNGVQYWLDQLTNGAYQHVVFVLSGSDQALASVLGDMPRHPGLTTVFTGHQLTQDIKDARQLPDIIAIPLSVRMTADERVSLNLRTNLVQVAGVATDLTPETLATISAQYREKDYPAIPPITRDTVAVILGGDVQDETGLHRFTEDDARALARRILKLEFAERENCDFVVLNGRRTGEFGSDGKRRNPDPHRTGQVDPVTQAFAESLSGHSGSTVHVRDFQFDRLPSAYAPTLAAFRAAGTQAGRLHVPGDSTSMVYEGASLLSPGAIVIDKTPAMNDTHHAEVEAMATEHGVPVLDDDGNLVRKPGASNKPVVSAARKIAEAIAARIPIRTDEAQA